MAEQADVLIVGAGIAGLACARGLAVGGGRPIVLDRARGVGGRCATRRVGGQPVDHGLAFLHGKDPGLLTALAEVDVPRHDGWPHRVHGRGTPCQPVAFRDSQHRVAFEDGVSSFPKRLARGLDVRLGQKVERLTAEDGTVVAVTHTGASYRSATVVLALALEQALPFLDALDDQGDEVVAMQQLLGTLATVPCLTVLAGYPYREGEPPWDIAYPEVSSVLLLVSNDAAKRRRPAHTTLVMQARPAWSREHIDDPPAAWSSAILREAEGLVGPWVGSPAWLQPHRWLHARLEPGNELAAPVLLDLARGGRLGLVGELFGAGGGVEAAYVSGRRLAQRLLDEGGIP